MDRIGVKQEGACGVTEKAIGKPHRIGVGERGRGGKGDETYGLNEGEKMVRGEKEKINWAIYVRERP